MEIGKDGLKKGRWTQEEDLILASYVQEHGAGNWKSIPANTGLLRCGKSCRKRWINYLRPGIKHGEFTETEVDTIFHLQALFGNRWTKIASVLPGRTEIDVKNYWYSHLEKKQMKSHEGHGQEGSASSLSKSKHALSQALSLDKQSSFLEPKSSDSSTRSSTAYPFTVAKITQLLENWKKEHPMSSQTGAQETTLAAGSSSIAAPNAVPVTADPNQHMSVLEKWVMQDANVVVTADLRQGMLEFEKWFEQGDDNDDDEDGDNDDEDEDYDEARGLEFTKSLLKDDDDSGDQGMNPPPSVGKN